MGARYPSFVSAVDRDGNEVAGLQPPELLAPGATFTGWNLRHPDQGAPGDLMSMVGSTQPFPLTRDEQERTSDPRPSIQERYGDRATHLARMREALGPAVAARHVLTEDADAIVERAGQFWDFLHGGRRAIPHRRARAVPAPRASRGISGHPTARRHGTVGA